MQLVTLRRPQGGSAGIALGDEILDLGAAADLMARACLLPHSVRGILCGGIHTRDGQSGS